MDRHLSSWWPGMRPVFAIAIAIVTIVGVNLPAGLAAREHAPAQGDERRVAVMEMERVGASPGEGAALTERFREAIFATGRFVIVNRTQIDKILAEQAFQQAGCTERNCAVKVGRILGVRRIVTGRATKLSERSWQISAQLVDVESSRTLEVKTLFHEGEFQALLRTGIPRLARLLTGQEKDPQPAVSSAGKTEEPQAGGFPTAKAEEPPRPEGAALQTDRAPPLGAAIKLAVFPPWVRGPLAWRMHRKYPEFIEKLAARGGEKIRIVFSYFPLPGARFLPRLKEERQEFWLPRKNGLGRRPRIDLIRRIGEKLGVDAVLLHSLDAGKNVGRYIVFVIGVRSGGMIHRAGEGARKQLLTRLSADTKNAVREFFIAWNGARRSG